MKTPTKFVKPLTEEQRKELKEIMNSQASQRKRMRTHAVLLSERRYSINHIADIYQVDRDRVSEWINWWNEFEFEGLDDDERGGRPPVLKESERHKAVELVKEEPRKQKTPRKYSPNIYCFRSSTGSLTTTSCKRIHPSPPLLLNSFLLRGLNE